MMTYNEKALLPYDDDHLDIEPMTVLDIRCHQCRRTWRVPVQNDFTDWRLIAKEYDRRYRMILSRINEYIKELETEVGPLPSTLRTKELLIQLREMVARMHEQDTRERDRLRRQNPESPQ